MGESVSQSVSESGSLTTNIWKNCKSETNKESHFYARSPCTRGVVELHMYYVYMIVNSICIIYTKQNS